MAKAKSPGQTVLGVIWIVAMLVTIIGGSWDSPSDMPRWKFDIQVPGIWVALYLGSFLGPLQKIIGPAVVCFLTIAINVACYYAVVRTVWFFGGALKSKVK